MKILCVTLFFPGPFKVKIFKHDSPVEAGSAAKFDIQIKNHASGQIAKFELIINGVTNKTFTLEEDDSKR